MSQSIPQNYELFALKKQLTVKKQSKGVADSDINIRAVAVGGRKENEWTALYCSNDVLIFRYVGESGIPLIRTMQWFTDAPKRIVRMCFNHSAQWLMCSSADFTIVLIPIYFLVKRNTRMNADFGPGTSASDDSSKKGKKSSSFGRGMMKVPSYTSLTSKTPQPSGVFGSIHDITVITVSSTLKPKITASDCVWWRTWEGNDYGIVSSNQGTISFINFQTQEEQLVIKIKYPITSIQLITNTTHSLTYLLIATAQNGYWKLLVEQEVMRQGALTYETILSVSTENGHSSKSQKDNIASDDAMFGSATPFTPVPLTNFAQEALITPQQTKQRQLLGVYDTHYHRLEVFDPELTSRIPLFVFQLTGSSNTVAIRLTERMTFVCSNDSEGGKVYAISNLIAASNSQQRGGPLLRNSNESVLQEFFLPKEEIRGIFKCFSSATAEDTPKGPGNLEGFLLWTSKSIYECVQKVSPSEIFYGLVHSGAVQNYAEPLGKSVGLDLLNMYENAADFYFNAKNYGRALPLYYLSNVKSSKLVYKYMSVDRMDIVFSHLRAALHQPAALSVNERKKLSNVLFKCYVQTYFNNKEDFSVIENEFSTFVNTSEDYDVDKALRYLLKNHLVFFALQVAHARGVVNNALSLLSTVNVHYLDSKCLQFLEERGYSYSLINCGGGTIFRSLSVEKQLQFLLCDPMSIPRFVKRIYDLIPYLEKNQLVQLARLFDPCHANSSRHSGVYGASTFKATNSGSLRRLIRASLSQAVTVDGRIQQQDDETNLDDTPATAEECIELFITVVLRLNYLRIHAPTTTTTATNTNPSPSPSTPRLSMRQSIELSRASSRKATETAAVKSRQRSVTLLSSGWNHCVAVTSLNEVFSWGRNNEGQLGVTTSSSISTAHDDDKFIATSYAGKVNLGVLTYEPPPPMERIPVQVTNSFGGRRVTQVACGGEHTVLVEDNCIIYSWGKGDRGQLGHGDKLNRLLPHRVDTSSSKSPLKNCKILQVTCGYSHTLLLTELPPPSSPSINTLITTFSPQSFIMGGGEMFVCGAADQGQTGLGDRNDVSAFTKIGIDSRIVEVACGYCHSAALSETGEVYTWGNGSYGQLGHASVNDQLFPKLVEALAGKRIIKIACGSFHTAAVTELESVYTWGKGGKNRLGHGDSSEDQRIPKLVDSITEHVQSVSCGHSHTVLLTTDGHVYTMGENENGKLGVDLPSTSSASRESPRRPQSRILTFSPFASVFLVQGALQNETVVNVACGEHHTFVLTESGKVYSWGSNQYGQLGLDDTDDRPTPTAIEPLYNTSITVEEVETISANNSGVLPSVHTVTDDMFDQEVLESTLRNQYRMYRPSLILHRCIDYDNYNGASVIYELMGDWVMALECRLTYLKTCFNSQNPNEISQNTSSPSNQNPNKQRVNASTNNMAPTASQLVQSSFSGLLQKQSEINEVLSLFEYFVTLNNVDEKTREHIVFVMLKYWQERNLSIESFESFIIKHTQSHIASPLCHLIEHNIISSSPWLLPFSPQLYMTIAKAYIENLNKNDDDVVTEDKLWSEIKDNLSKDISKYQEIILSTMSLQTQLSFSKEDSPSSYVVFTCGHHFSKKTFFEELLPELQQRLELLHHSVIHPHHTHSHPYMDQQQLSTLNMPVKNSSGSQTQHLLLAEYHQQKQINLACPVCTYNFIATQFKDRLGVKAQQWKHPVVI